jgi:hypothetical protein
LGRIQHHPHFFYFVVVVVVVVIVVCLPRLSYCCNLLLAMSAAITPTSSSEDEPNEFPREMKTFARHEYEHYKKHMKDNTQIFVENPHDPLHKFLDVCEATRRLREIKSTFEPDVGEVFLSGSNDLSALGDACAQGDMITKFQLFDTTQSKIVRVEAGGQVSFVLDERGRLFSWGSRDDGGLGRRIPEGDPFDLELSVERVRNFKPSNHALVKINKTDEGKCEIWVVHWIYVFMDSN